MVFKGKKRGFSGEKREEKKRGKQRDYLLQHQATLQWMLYTSGLLFPSSFRHVILHEIIQRFVSLSIIIFSARMRDFRRWRPVRAAYEAFCTLCEFRKDNAAFVPPFPRKISLGDTHTHGRERNAIGMTRHCGCHFSILRAIRSSVQCDFVIRLWHLSLWANASEEERSEKGKGRDMRICTSLNGSGDPNEMCS